MANEAMRENWALGAAGWVAQESVFDAVFTPVTAALLEAAALDGARPGPVPEGNVGGGTGMVCHGFKGGIGTASRRLDPQAGGYTVGVLVQCNYGVRRELRGAGGAGARARGRGRPRGPRPPGARGPGSRCWRPPCSASTPGAPSVSATPWTARWPATRTPGPRSTSPAGTRSAGRWACRCATCSAAPPRSPWRRRRRSARATRRRCARRWPRTGTAATAPTRSRSARATPRAAASCRSATATARSRAWATTR